MAEIVIHDGNWTQHVRPVVAGERKGHGLVPRDFRVRPHGSLSFAVPFGQSGITPIPQSEWQARADLLKAAGARLSDVRAKGMGGSPVPSRDQDGVGYCWCHSGVSAHLVARAAMNEPYVDLSPFAIGCMIKGFRDEGGNGIEGVQFQAEKGCPDAAHWPQRSMSRSNDNPATWQNAALHKYRKWVELDPHDMKNQFVTCLLLGMPVVSDYNWWSHSVCAIDLDSVSPFRVRIWNSWGDSWSENGTGLLEEGKAVPDDAVALQVVSPSVT